MIEKADFRRRFNKAAQLALGLAREIVVEPLPDALLFSVVWRQAVEVSSKARGKVKYLGGRLLLPTDLVGVDAERAVNLLWVDGKVPRWINLDVCGADDRHTFVRVRHTNVLGGDLERLMHHREGNPPFHVLGPPVPEGWKPGQRIRLGSTDRLPSGGAP